MTGSASWRGPRRRVPEPHSPPVAKALLRATGRGAWRERLGVLGHGVSIPGVRAVMPATGRRPADARRRSFLPAAFLKATMLSLLGAAGYGKE